MISIEIQQGKPHHKFFTIAVPKKSFGEPLKPGETSVTLTHPKNGSVVKCIYYGHWDIKNEQEFIIANRFCLITYGGGSMHLIEKLKEQYPELKENFEVEYWILKEE